MNNIILVSQLNKYIKSIFDNEEMVKNILLCGEISNFKVNGQHAYFTLCDEFSAIDCTFFGFASKKMMCSNGDMAVFRGSPNIYTKTGRLSFNCMTLISTGTGALSLKYLELKQKLEQEGLFDEKFKKPIPKFAKRVGIVTSETGAVIRDILKVADRKKHTADIFIFGAKVQGIGADLEICKGIETLDKFGVDVIVVARGGGSEQDIEPFYKENVARCVFACKTPIVSAVGHETDWTLCDFVADARASTPTAAGELVFFDKAEVLDFIFSTQNVALNRFEKIFSSNKLKLANNLLKASSFAEKMIEINKNSVYNQLQRLFQYCQQKLQKEENNLQNLQKLIDNSNIKKVLDRGFALVQKGEKKVTLSKQIEKGDHLELQFADGSVEVEAL